MVKNILTDIITHYNICYIYRGRGGGEDEGRTGFGGEDLSDRPVHEAAGRELG